MNPHNFFAELKRGNVYKVAVAHVVIAYLFTRTDAMVAQAGATGSLR